MAIPDYGTIYVPENADEIRATILEDMRIGFQNAGVTNPVIEPGSDNYIFATALANALMPLYAGVQLSGQNVSELTATGEALDDIREAIGLPEVEASGASGQLIVTVLNGGSATILDGTQFLLPNGILGSVDGTQVVSNGGLITVVTDSTGDITNTAGGTIVRFINPPLNVATEAVVSDDGLTGGIDTEDDEAKRQRILLRRRDLPAGGNVAYLRDTALSSSAAVQQAYVYPALGGPGSIKLVVTKAYKPSNDDYSRELDSVTIVENAVNSEIPVGIKLTVQSVVDENTDIGIMLDLPTPATGQTGWTNTAANLWPQLVSGDNGKVTVTAVTSTTEITVSANTSTTPSVGVSKIMWFCTTKKSFVESTITAYSGSTGAWVLTLSTPLTKEGINVAVGDFISPSCTNANEYVSNLINKFDALAPGENTSNPNINTGSRGARRPVAQDSITNSILANLANEFDEIQDFGYSYRLKSNPTIPANVETAPNVLVLRHLGFYYYNESLI